MTETKYLVFLIRKKLTSGSESRADFPLHSVCEYPEEQPYLCVGVLECLPGQSGGSGQRADRLLLQLSLHLLHVLTAVHVCVSHA
jgi:hypothetical protein